MSRKKQRLWTAIPNFVDTAVFRPAVDVAERRACRRSLGITEEANVLGCVAAIKRDHKRIDYLVEEFARLCAEDPERDWFLAVAGADQGEETTSLLDMAGQRAPGRVGFFVNLSRERMPVFYRALDLFGLTSLFEMMPIAVLEALASGLPVVLNDHPVLRWMSGMEAEESERGGVCVDMGREGALATALRGMDDGQRAALGRGARARATGMFSKDAVIRQYIAFYTQVAECGEGRV